MTTMDTQAISASERHRRVAREWIDAFNDRDDDRESAARTADYTAHAPTCTSTSRRPRPTRG